MKVNNENYVTVQGWMLRLGLSSSTEVMAFALVYGFCQDDESEFQGSIKYIQEWLMCGTHTAIKTMNTLVEKGLVEKRQLQINGVTFNRYRCVSNAQIAEVLQKMQRGSAEFAEVGTAKNAEGTAKSAHNNTIINTTLNNRSSLTSNPTTPINNEIKEPIKEKAKKKSALSFEFLDEPDNVLWASAMNMWFDYKREIGDMYKTQHGVEGALDDLKKACNNDSTKASQVVTFCIHKEWKGIYKPKELFNGTSNSNTGEPDLSKLTSQQRILYFAEQMHNARIAEQGACGGKY